MDGATYLEKVYVSFLRCRGVQRLIIVQDIWPKLVWKYRVLSFSVVMTPLSNH